MSTLTTKSSEFTFQALNNINKIIEESDWSWYSGEKRIVELTDLIWAIRYELDWLENRIKIEE